MHLRSLVHSRSTSISSISISVFRAYSTSTSSLPFPTVSKCPSPTCACPPTPKLDIDQTSNISGLVAEYSEHVVIATGRDDWTSRIEQDGNGTGWGDLSRGLKPELRNDPFNNILVTNSSFLPSRTAGETAASALLFPSRVYIPHIPTSGTGAIHPFIHAFLQPTKLHPAHGFLPAPTKKSMIRDKSLQGQFHGLVDLSHDITVLICGHGGRDVRCKIMAPLLKTVFEDVLKENRYDIRSDEVPSSRQAGDPPRGRVGLISHIGGHKFAGNVIIYMPSQSSTVTSEGRGLLGKGIWYGRVEPKHVEGLVKETVQQGRVVTELCRGVVDDAGKIYKV